MKVISESLLVTNLGNTVQVQCDPPPPTMRQVITTEELQNFQHLAGNFNSTLIPPSPSSGPHHLIPSPQVTSDKMTEILAKYLYQQQQQAKLITAKTPPTFPRFQKTLAPTTSPIVLTPVKDPGISNNTGLVTSGGPRDFIPFKCPLCSLIYQTQAFLNEHMRREHSVLI